MIPLSGDIEENIQIHVSGAEGLANAAEEAEALKNRIDSVRDAWAEEGAAADEAGAEGAAGAAEQAAALEAVKAQLDGVRDKYAEAGAAADLAGSKTSGMTDALKAADAASRQLTTGRDSLGRTTVNDPWAGMIRDRYANVEKEIQQAGRSQQEIDRAMQDMERSIPHEGMLGLQAGMGAATEMERYAESVDKAKQALADADPVISDSGLAIGDLSRKAGIAATAMGNWHAATEDIGHGGLPSVASGAAREMDGALADLATARSAALPVLNDIGQAAGDAGQAMGEAGQEAGDLGSAFGDIGGPLGQVGTTLQGLAMPAMWTALASGISTIGPVALSAGTGFAAFGAMAYPALRQVEHGLTNVTAARQQYQQAAAVAKFDPTKQNLANEQTALAQLKATWATMPSDVRQSVSAIEQLGHAWSEAGKKSGIQRDVMRDIPKAIGDIKGLIPDIAKLGKATAPVISGMISDFGKFEKSSGFSRWISNIRNEIPKAMPALGKLGNAFSTLIGDLTTPKNMQIGNQLLGNLSGMIKSITPATVNELGNVAKSLSGIAGATSRATKPGGFLQQTGRFFDDWAGFYGAQNRVEKAAIGPAFSGGGSALHWLSTALFGPLGSAAGAPKSNLGAEVSAAGRKALEGLKIAGGKTGDVRLKVDDSGLSKAKSDLASLHREAGKSDKADVKITSTGADKAKSDLKDVTSAAKQAGNTKASISVTVTGTQAAVSSLNSVGSASSRMASGVSAGSAQATGAVSRMASSIRGAITPLPAAFHAAGLDAGAGLASGIQASTGEAVAAARSMASQVEAAARTELQTHSPSRKFQRIGADTILGYILGLEGGKGRVQAAMNAVLGAQPFKDTVITRTVNELRKKLESMSSGVFPNPMKSWQESGLTKLLDADNKKLMGLAKQRMDLLNQIKAADALAKSVETAAASLGDVTTIAPNTQQGLIQADMAQSAPGTQQNPYQNIQAGMKYQLSQIRQFRADIIKLKKEGLDKASIKQLLQAGIAGGGLSTAEQILGEGPGAAKQIASLQKQIEQASKQLGITGGNAAYESASQIGRALAAGLKDSLKAVNQEMASIAKTLVTSLMTALGASGKDIREALKKLDKELGIGDGSGGGKRGGAKPGPIVEHHRGAHPGPIVEHHHPARHEPPGWGPMMPVGRPGPITVGGNDTQTINNVITVLLDGKVVSRSTQAHTLRRARRNTRSGMTLPLRGT